MQFALSPIHGHPTEAVEMEALTIPKMCNLLGPVKLNLKNSTRFDSWELESIGITETVNPTMLQEE